MGVASRVDCDSSSESKVDRDLRPSEGGMLARSLPEASCREMKESQCNPIRLSADATDATLNEGLMREVSRVEFEISKAAGKSVCYCSTQARSLGIVKNGNYTDNSSEIHDV